MSTEIRGITGYCLGCKAIECTIGAQRFGELISTLKHGSLLLCNVCEHVAKPAFDAGMPYHSALPAAIAKYHQEASDLPAGVDAGALFISIYKKMIDLSPFSEDGFKPRDWKPATGD